MYELALGIWLVASVKTDGGLLLRLLPELLAVHALIERTVGDHDPIVMLGVLQITLGSDPIAGGIGVASQLTITVEDMRSRAANLHIGSAAVEVSLAAAAPTHLMGLAATARTPAARTLLIYLSHVVGQVVAPTGPTSADNSTAGHAR